MTPEAKARQSIDALLEQAGWHVCDMADANIHAARGVALREFPLNTGYGFADYLLYIDGRAAGVIEAKKAGSTLTGVEVQSARYAKGLPESLPAWLRPLPFSYESTGIETHFTQGLDPHPRARSVFAFHRPETLAALLQYLPASGANLPTGAVHTGTEVPSGTHFGASTFLTRLQSMPQLLEDGLWPAQITAIRNLEASLAANKPRALIQMATGSGKTYTAISFIYRLIKFARAKRVLFLVDRGNLGRQTKKEFDAYDSPYNNYKFGEEYIVQHLQSNQLDTTARITICTIQRLFSMLKGRELAAEDDEQSVDRLGHVDPQDALRRAGRRPGLRCRRAGPCGADARPDPHHRAHLPRPVAHGDIPRPHRGTENPGVRQGRQPRRKNRRDPARRVRQGQRICPEDHLPHHRRQAGEPDQRLSQQLLPAHRRHRGHDRHRHRHQAGRNRHVHARREKPQLLRADEGPRRAHHRAHRPAGGDARRQVQGPLRHRRLRGCVRARQDRLCPMDQKKSVPFDKLLQAVALGNVEPEVLSSIAARLARLDRDITDADKQRIVQASGGASLRDLARGIVDALDPDKASELSPHEADQLMQRAVKPLCDPALRKLLMDLKRQAEQIIDTVTQDQLLDADFSEAARARAKGTVESFERFIAEHKDEITALQILYNRPQRLLGVQAADNGAAVEPLTFDALKALADQLQAPPHLWTESQLWHAYAALDKTRVKDNGNRRRILTDLVSLVRFAMHQDNELVPYPERVNANFKAWLARSGTSFTSEQLHWLDMIRDHIAANLGIEPDDFEYSPFAQEGGIGRVYQLFGAEFPKVLEEMNRELAA